MKIAKPYLPTISVDVQSVQWIANRLEDFAFWPGIPKSRVKRLVSMAKHLRKLCGEKEREKVAEKKSSISPIDGDAIINAVCNGISKMLNGIHSDCYYEFTHAIEEIQNEWEATKKGVRNGRR